MQDPINTRNNNTSNSNDNPILKLYEEFQSTTGIVTRYIVYGIIISYITSWFVGTTNILYSLSCIPQFTLYQYYEIYRIITSILVNIEFFNIFFAIYLLTQQYKLLEYSIGSMQYIWLSIIIFTILSNSIFVIVSIILYYSTSNNNTILLLHQSNGIWTCLFGLLSYEACMASQYHKQRRLFFCQVPTIYYPIALFGIFTLLGSGSIQCTQCISMLLGYGIGLQKYNINKYLLLPITTIQHYEQVYSTKFQNINGWIFQSSSMGTTIWTNQQHQQPSSTQQQSIFSSLFQQQQQDIEHGSASTSHSFLAAGRPPSDSTNNNTSIMPTTAGHTLGSSSTTTAASQRHHHSKDAVARAARLQALEQRTSNSSTTKNKQQQDNSDV